MIYLNVLAYKAFEISQKRNQVIGGALKHCAGEVIEAQIERDNLENIKKKRFPTKEEYEKYGMELADIIICVLTESYISHVDIEEMINKKMEINEERSKKENE